MADTPLVVPMQCDALVVNKGVLGRDSFRWWPFNYLALQHYLSPEPEALDRFTGGAKTGVYLHWTLPRALRQTSADGDGAYPLVPNRWLILRVNGTDQRQTTAWVIESDCPFTTRVQSADATQSSLYLADSNLIRMWKASPDPYRNTVTLDLAATAVQHALIGVRFPLAQGWSERDPGAMFLTAVAPANPVFSIYCPHNTGVFSFYDDLAQITSDVLSYCVLGWYSDPKNDIMASWQSDSVSQHPYQALLDRLGWMVACNSETQATMSVYEGMVLSLQWDLNGNPPPNDPLQQVHDNGTLNVALGNTTIDAFTALIGQQLKNPQQAELLRAFQYDFLSLLNQVNGEALLAERIHQEWFGSKPGGYSWTIVPKTSDSDSLAELTDPEAQWLLQLNQDQASLDQALAKLFSLQWDLQADWYRSGFLADPSNTFPTPPDGIPDGGLQAYQRQLAAALDPGVPASIASQVISQIQTVKGLLARVPQPDWSNATTSQEAFQNGITAFAAANKLSADKLLKAVVAPRYWQPNNPVILLSGVEPAVAADPNETLVCRLATGLVSGFTVAGTAITTGNAGAAVPSPGDLSGLPGVVPALIQEFVLLDPSNAAAIAATAAQSATQVATTMTAHTPSDYQGTLPDLDLSAWTQPWNPIFLEWKANYTHIPYQTAGKPNWTFDGTDYHYTPAAAPAMSSRPVGGISLLSPHAQFVFGSRLADFIARYGAGTDLAKLNDWIAQVYQWKFLAQEMTGFHELMALRDTRAYRRPSPYDQLGSGGSTYPLDELVGYAPATPGGDYTLPDAHQGQVNAVPYIPNGAALPFYGARLGQIYFTDLLLYDKFGRVLYVIESAGKSGLFDYTNFPVHIDTALLPDTSVTPAVASVAQLPPRLLQHARLDFRLIDGTDDTRCLDLDPNVNPICGWVLPNHLDNSLLLYAPDGQSLGQLRLVVSAQGTASAEWQAPPHSAINSLDDVAAVAPQLRALLSAPAIQQEANFRAFLLAIDETLWTIDPLGDRADQNLSVLIGRPLALVRARLQFQLDGLPLRDTGWAAALAPPDPDLLTYPFCIRIGDQATRQDGVIGYYLGQNYNVFNSVVAPETLAAQSYITPIGAPGSDGANYIRLTFQDQTYVYVTLLVDPRTAIHATTGIVPVKQVNIPSAFIQEPLSNIEVCFRMGPLLTLIEQTPAQGEGAPLYPQAITYPLPSEQNGTWSWWEYDAGRHAWSGYAQLDATANAQLKDVPNTLREGFFQLLVNLKKNA